MTAFAYLKSIYARDAVIIIALPPVQTLQNAW